MWIAWTKRESFKKVLVPPSLLLPLMLFLELRIDCCSFGILRRWWSYRYGEGLH
jgi:hypothetical protein